MKAKFISTEGEYLVAIIEVNGKKLHVMDEFSTEALSSGETVYLEIVPGLYYEKEEWESMFTGNPEAKKELEHQSSWRYRAYGIVTSIKPVMVDVGLFEIEAPIESNDEALVGESVAFTIERLDASPANKSTQATPKSGAPGF
ncbi:MAG: hypothetical protein OEZ39_16300 [Gammaproteobacteria bacterium]|nr:hypothetical protein [Gammaproteobacteria bacterium]MDH5653421.1 hypothetical protein [Gammaproteobacteria bacterium]